MEKKPKKAGFHLEIWQLILLAFVVILLVAYCAVSYISSNILQPPAIRSTSSGNHLYSSLGGGVSFDYPQSWGLAPFDWISFIMTGGERPHFMMINGEESHFLFLTFDSPQIQSAPTGPQDCPKLGSALNATSRWVEWGSSQGCLKFTPARGKYLEDYFFTGRCSEILNYTAAGGHESDLREVLSTLRCGPQAVK